MFLFKETSFATDNLEFIDTSPLAIIRFPTLISFVKPAVVPVNVDNLFVTYAVVASLLELSLVGCVVADTIPFIETSPLTYNFPLKDTSLPTDKREFMDTSPPMNVLVVTVKSLFISVVPNTWRFLFNEVSLPTDRREFIETSPLVKMRFSTFISFVKLAVNPVNVDNLFVTYAVVATLFELSLVGCVLTDTIPLIETSPLTYNFPFIETSPPINVLVLTVKSLFNIVFPITWRFSFNDTLLPTESLEFIEISPC